LELFAMTKGRVFGDRLQLERGEASLTSGPRFHFEANSLSIYPASETSAGRVAILGMNRVRVTAATGSLRVLNTRGTLVATIPAGTSLELEPMSNAAGVRVTGRLENKGGKLLLTDETTHVTVEVVGDGIATEAGNRVQLTGTVEAARTPAADASQVVRA